MKIFLGEIKDSSSPSSSSASALLTVADWSTPVARRSCSCCSCVPATSAGHLQGCAMPVPHPVGTHVAADQHFCSPLPCRNPCVLWNPVVTIATGCYWFKVLPIANAQSQLSHHWQASIFYSKTVFLNVFKKIVTDVRTKKTGRMPGQGGNC